MASRVHPLGQNRKRPWRARVKLNHFSYFLGYYATEDEAKEVEEDFRSDMGAPDRAERSRRAWAEVRARRG